MSFPYEVGDLLKSTESLLTVKVLEWRYDGFRYEILTYGNGDVCTRDNHINIFVTFTARGWIKLSPLLRELF
jgi:hypothetical protein